jgi:cellobiose transport system substrate-binding protein
VNVKLSRRTTAVAIAGTAAAVLVLTGCAAGGNGGSTGAPTEAPSDEPVTLTVATFNNFGYTDELLAQYTAEHPNVTIEHTIAATSNDARSNYFTKLGAGSGLADVEAVEIDWFAELMQYSDKLYDLSDPSLADRWVPWKTEAATDADGRLVAYGTDIGPEGICYRADLFEAAGLPTDPDEVADLLTGDWDTYFEVGQQYVDKTGKAWFDSAAATYQGMINQVQAAYEDPDTGEVIATENPEVKDIYETVLEASATESAHLSQWSPDWAAGQASGAYATMLCPGWMLGVISGNAPDVTDWRVANAFPGGGGNWGGSYLTVPAQGAHLEEAKALANWLTSPEVQLQAFNEAGTFPSQQALYTDEALLGATNEYFGDQAVGGIFADRAADVTVAPFKGPKYFPINDAVVQALGRVDIDKTDDAASSWEKFVADVNSIG